MEGKTSKIFCVEQITELSLLNCQTTSISVSCTGNFEEQTLQNPQPKLIMVMLEKAVYFRGAHRDASV